MSNMDYTNNENLQGDESLQGKENLDKWISSNQAFNNANNSNYTYGMNSEVVQNFEKKMAEANDVNGFNQHNGGQMSSMSWEGNGQVEQQQNFQYSDNANNSGYNKTRGAKPFVTIAISVVLSAAVGFGSGLLALRYGSDRTNSSKGETTIVKQVTAEQEIDDTLTTESIVNAVADSVVEITTESVETGSFFGDYITSGAGSGIIISADGYIATNDHVISGANKVIVRLKNGEEYEAKLVGTDAQTDIALLKVEADNLQPVTFGDSDDLSVGEKAIVIGNPLGELGGTVSCGIISAVDREVTIDNQKKNLLQTDAAVNPGNSGGPLFDGKGNVVGMVEAKSTGSDVEGIGFVIPSNTVVKILDELKEHGRVTGRPYLGIQMIDIKTMQDAYQRGLNHLGTYIEGVVKGSAAEKAGLKAWDCIVKVDGKEILDFSEIKSIISEKKVGDRFIVTVLRVINGEEKTLDIEVQLGEQNDTAESSIQKYNR